MIVSKLGAQEYANGSVLDYLWLTLLILHEEDKLTITPN